MVHGQPTQPAIAPRNRASEGAQGSADAHGDAPAAAGARFQCRAGGRAARISGSRVVRPRPSPACRGRTHRHERSARSPRERKELTTFRRRLAATAKETSVHSESANLASSINLYPLCGRLFCRCGAPFCRWGSPDANREYMSVCGCRLRPVNAVLIERRVYADAARLDPASAIGGSSEALAEVLTRLYTRIEVGGTVDDVRFVPRP
jgi:hypothetical protein